MSAPPSLVPEPGRHVDTLMYNAKETREAVLGPLLGGVVALAAAMGIGRFAYTPILPAMQAATHLATSQAAFLASANYAGYFVGALAVTPISRVAARGRALMVCLVVVVGTTALMACTTNMVAWSSIRFLSGLASAGVFVLASSTVLAVLRRHGRIHLSGWLYSGVGVGIALSGSVVRVTGGKLGWRGEWFALAMLAAVAIVPSGRWLSVPPASPATTMVDREQETIVPRTRARLALILLAYLLQGTGYIVTGTFLVAIVERMPGLQGFGASVWIVVGLAAAPATILWAALALRIGYASALVLAYTAQACGIALPLLGGAGAVLLSAALFGGTFMGISSLTLTLAGQLAPRRAGGILGLLTAAFGLGQIAGPALAGVLAGSAQTYAPALTVAATIVLLGALLMAAAWQIDRLARVGRWGVTR